MIHSFCSSANNIEHVKSIHVSLIYLYDTSTQIPRPKLRDSSFPLGLQIELFETKLCGKFMFMKYSWINFSRKSFLRARSWKLLVSCIEHDTILYCSFTPSSIGPIFRIRKQVYIKSKEKISDRILDPNTAL